MITHNQPLCAGCGMPKSQWKGNDGEGYSRLARNGEVHLYCCSGCAVGRCTCWPSEAPDHRPMAPSRRVGV